MTQNPDHGAFVPGQPVKRQPLAAGPLHNLTFAVKDLIDIAGEVTGGGNPDWARTHGPADQDAPAVQQLRQAGATLHGKTITDELAFSLEGANAHFGTPRNPRAPDRLPGGSSSGSAVAVAAGLVDFALGTDTGGSVRVPAAFCGVFGFRPTHGRVSLQGVLPFAPSYDTIGWFARSGKALQRVGQVLLAPRAHTPQPLQLRCADDVFELIDSPCAEVLRPLAQALGAHQGIRLFDGDHRPWLTAYQVLQGHEIRRSLGDWIATTQPRFGPHIASRFAALSAITDEEDQLWQAWRAKQADRLQALLGTHGGWVLPTTPCLPLLKTAGDAEIGRFYERALAINAIAGHAGLPQVTLPIGMLDGLPLGLSVIGPRGSDEALLALAAGVESAR